jgi:hypothetical protein
MTNDDSNSNIEFKTANSSKDYAVVIKSMNEKQQSSKSWLWLVSIGLIFLGLFLFLSILPSDKKLKTIKVNDKELLQALEKTKKEFGFDANEEPIIKSALKNITILDKLNDQAGLVLSDSDVADASKSLNRDNINLKDPRQYLAAYSLASSLKASNELPLKMEGGVFVFSFSRRISKAPNQALEHKYIDGMFDNKLIEEDRKYALEKAKYYYDKLQKDPNINLESVLNEIRADERLRPLNARNESYLFEPINSEEDLRAWREKNTTHEAAYYINQQLKKGLSPIMLSRLGSASQSDQFGRYVFVFVKDYTNNSVSYQEYLSVLNNSKESF